MTKLSVICPESVLIPVKGQMYPAVVLIGRDETLKRRIWQTKYFPYFYLVENDYLEIKDSGYFDGLHVQDVSGSMARNLMRRVMTKISVTDAGRIGDSIHAINKMNKQGRIDSLNVQPTNTIYTYEADLSKPDVLALRYMIDKGIRSGAEIDDVTHEFLRPVELSLPLRKWYIDFEAFTIKEYSSGMGKDEPIIMLSVWDTYESKMYTYYSVNPKWKVEWQITNFLEKLKDTFKKNDLPIHFEHEIRVFKTEANLLDAIMDLVIEKDPDMFIAWNLNKYDIRKWKQRVELNTRKCLHPFKDISPMKSIMANSRPMRIKGRVLFDLMVAFKQYTDAEIRSYALGFITEEEELGFPKIPFESTSGHTWDVRPDIMFTRNVYDVLIEKALDEKYEVSETYNDLRTEFGTLFHETFIRYRVIDTALMRLVHNKVVLKTCDLRKPPEEDKLLGAIVKEPKPNKYYWVIQLDFGREYPNIIKGFNISPETYLKCESKEDCYVITYTTPDGRELVFRFTKERIGLLPQLIKFFDKKRDEYEKGKLAAIARGESDDKVKVWDRRAYNVKKTTNAIYGVMDFPKFRLSRKECTQATAIVGRISVEELTKFSDSIGYEILYGDTDSMFIKLHYSSQEEAIEEGKNVQRMFNEHLSEFFTDKYGIPKAPADLGFKKIYKKIIFFGKKTYAGKSIWDEKKGWREEYDFKGIASVRTDSSDLERSSLETLLKLVLNDEKDSTIIEFVNKVLADYDARKYDYLDIAYPAQIKRNITFNEKTKKWTTDYAKVNKKGKIQIPSHITAAVYSNMYLNTEFGTGDKPRRLCIKFSKKNRTEKNQSTLFGTKVSLYPTEWEWYGKRRKVTAISVVEDMHIPQYFIEHIDWERIKKRLEGKLYKVVSTNSIGESV